MLLYFVEPFPKYLFKTVLLWKVSRSVLIMSDQVQTPSYPSLRTEHLEILPNLSQRICYQDIPTMMPALSSDEKATFLNIMVKCFVPDTTNEETKFHISFLDNDEAATAIRQISPQFSWVKRNQYSLLGLLNFVPDLVSSSTTTTRATTSELRDLLNAVMNHDRHKASKSEWNILGQFGILHQLK